MTIGRILPLTEDALELRFVSHEEAALRIGAFVYYTTEVDGQPQKILCRVTGRRNLDSPPESYYTSPGHHPEDLLAFTGAPDGILDDHVVTATLLGYKSGPTFRAPRDPPPVGAQVHLAEPDYLEDAINKVAFGQATQRKPGGLHIGHVLDRDNVRVVLDADSLLSTHMAVLAATGQGKSYTTGVILEELLASHQRHPILVFDFHCEYAAMQDAATVLKDGSYAPVVDVRTEQTIEIPFSELELDDLLGLMPGLSDNMVGVMAAAFRVWRADGIHSRAAFEAAVESLRGQQNFHEGSIDGVLRRFHGHVLGKPYFTDGQGEDLRDLIRPGCMTVLNLSNLGDLDQEGLCNAIMSLVLKARKLTKTGQSTGKKFFDLPYPLLMVVEEAHRIAPPGGEKRSTRTMSTILSEGRKFGVGAIIVTQRPGKVDSNVLSQCLSQVISRITNPLDQQNIRQSAENATTDLMELLPALGRGEAVIFGHVLSTPVVAGIRTRVTSIGGDHGSPTQDAIQAHKKAAATVVAKSGAPPPTQRRQRI